HSLWCLGAQRKGMVIAMTKKTTRTTRKETPFTNTGKAIKRKDMTIIADSTEYTILKDYRFEAATTMEYLSGYGMNCYNAILRFGNHVIFAAMNYKGETLAAIYEFAEEPHEDFGRIECRIRLVELADATFEDAGHAAAWAFGRLEHS
ncbi:MAG: hypothetical protein LUF28_08695, partial [Clostridiales bacterium]|nr:hypothetical protein [Clostridiales bacterium]